MTKYFFIALILIFSIFSGYIIFRAAWFVNDKHFSLLAQSFLRNDLFLSSTNLPGGDFVDFKAKQYLFFGPMPSIILIPFVFIWGSNFPQIFLSIASLLIVFYCIYLLCKKLGLSSLDSLYLASFFVFGTVLYFVSLVNISAYIVQAVATAFICLAILEYFTKRRWLIIGILTAAATATRITTFLIIVFFLLELYRNRREINLKQSLILLFLPIFLCIVFLGIYNQRRFHTPFDTGYTRNVSVLDKDYLNYKEGWFSPKHIPANLYALLFMAPETVKKSGVEFVLKPPYLKANGFGMAIWFTSPLFLYLLKAKREPYTYSAVIAIFALLVPSLVYMGIGASQFGYRYSLDFLPLLFLILLSAFKKGLPTFAKVLIALGIIFNCFYMLSIWNSYPLLSWQEYIN